jgi:hypothetical protein
MDAQPTRYRSPLANWFALIALLAAPAALRAELLVNAPPGEGPSPDVRPWAPSQAAASRPRREEADEEEDAPAPAAGAARPLLALMLALAIPPTMTASEVVSASDTSPKLDKVPTINNNTGGNTGGGGGGGGGGTTPQTSPEPASLISALVGIGLAGAAALARRRRAARRALAA